jgi:peroxiredoxin Q/BCP
MKEVLIMLKAGDKAVDFELTGSEGENIKLSDFKGRLIVLYFYPRDNTPGCTAEACSFRDVNNDLTAAGATVIGVSPDSAASHKSFAAKHNLNFHLLSDPDHKAAESYGAWAEKTLLGKMGLGIIRSTFVIGKNFDIIKVYPKVSPEGHGDEISGFIKSI